jgi:hypothetical protein
MFTSKSSRRARLPMHFTRPTRRPRATVEALEGRMLLTFNAYIAGLSGGSAQTDLTFVFSTTGQAAKHWDITWGDGNVDHVDAPNQVTGWTTPYTPTHVYQTAGDYPVSGTATSITNVTASSTPM